MIALVRTSAPATPIVTPAEVKLYGRISSSAQDAMLTELTEAATAAVEEITNRALITQTWKYVIKGFESLCVKFPKSPLQSIISAQYLDVNGNTETLDPGIYQVSTTMEPGEIRLKPGSMWPPVAVWYAEPVTFTYVAGYGDKAANVPQRIRQAIIALVVFWYDNSLDEPVPDGIKRALDNYQVFYEV
jgi:uncharacterized phiE125 gp8 family phage protein